jgi:hypothetical protein
MRAFDFFSRIHSGLPHSKFLEFFFLLLIDLILPGDSFLFFLPLRYLVKLNFLGIQICFGDEIFFIGTVGTSPSSAQFCLVFLVAENSFQYLKLFDVVL